MSGRYGCNDAWRLYEGDFTDFADVIEDGGGSGWWYGFGHDGIVGWFILEQDPQGFVNLHEFGRGGENQHRAEEVWGTLCDKFGEGVA